jgi:hypothetical protein
MLSVQPSQFTTTSSSSRVQICIYTAKEENKKEEKMCTGKDWKEKEINLPREEKKRNCCSPPYHFKTAMPTPSSSSHISWLLQSKEELHRKIEEETKK